MATIRRKPNPERRSDGLVIPGPFTKVNVNGALEIPPIERLISRLCTRVLAANTTLERPVWGDIPEQDPLYDDPSILRFSGDFIPNEKEWSTAYFCIDTNDKSLLDMFRSAIEKSKFQRKELRDKAKAVPAQGALAAAPRVRRIKRK